MLALGAAFGIGNRSMRELNPLPEATRTAGRSLVATSGISVVDGDTVRYGGDRFRLVGFDTPEKGSLARCASERELAERATSRLQEMVTAGAELRQVACSCPPGTEGTDRCNYGRKCAYLSVGGRDVGALLIGEGLAHPYHCSGTHCPRRQSWCN